MIGMLSLATQNVLDKRKVNPTSLHGTLEKKASNT